MEDIQRLLNLTRHQTHNALWELAAAGLAAADGFDQLRAMIDPERKPAAVAAHRKMRSAAGRWSLFSADIPAPSDALEKASRADAAIESAARMLLARYGVVFRDLVARESNIPRWGALLRMLRRLEDRGEVRGGRFVSGFGGEQFALPEAVESLRAVAASRYAGNNYGCRRRSHESGRHSHSRANAWPRFRAARSCSMMAWWRETNRTRPRDAAGAGLQRKAASHAARGANPDQRAGWIAVFVLDLAQRRSSPTTVVDRSRAGGTRTWSDLWPGD